MNNFFSFIWKHLNSQTHIMISGFMLGFLLHFNFDEATLKNPLMAMLSGSIYGSVTAFGALLVAEFMISPLRIIVPFVLWSSCIYSLMNK